MRRIGSEATARIDRRDSASIGRTSCPGGVVVRNEIRLVLDVEAILLDDLERTGAIDYLPGSISSGLDDLAASRSASSLSVRSCLRIITRSPGGRSRRAAVPSGFRG
jgi:hypothetical protein